MFILFGWGIAVASFVATAAVAALPVAFVGGVVVLYTSGRGYRPGEGILSKIYGEVTYGGRCYKLTKSEMATWEALREGDLEVEKPETVARIADFFSQFHPKRSKPA